MTLVSYIAEFSSNYPRVGFGSLEVEEGGVKIYKDFRRYDSKPDLLIGVPIKFFTPFNPFSMLMEIESF